MAHRLTHDVFAPNGTFIHTSCESCGAISGTPQAGQQCPNPVNPASATATGQAGISAHGAKFFTGPPPPPPMELEVLLSPSSNPQCTVVRARLLLVPKKVRVRFAKALFGIHTNDLYFSGFVRRVDNQTLELFIVTRNTTAPAELNTLWGLLNRWSVDKESIQYEPNNYAEVQYLNQRFMVLQANGEPDGWSNRLDDESETDSVFSVVSNIR
mmetsp:Transcript_89466/g.175106  ORF Transcript_89466/g.175106 Transcript_89466/m.175106 type:complete len:212 (+) Transcript_89466:40-675(+)|eukprot:CAMPEP_0170390336 /NCGR_PEP_ID=MMETSP0117_2-20130122/19092_1 /TAXON_ID=400756 /ORGANISM="Durinskia baltica, Strain CSIRO CS-38" /LENGTH=211 /DNA_ID=CAMNT_0010646375 /DNA_START=37 /DNA_END=672 /DNA_ORIENTATION=-